VQLRKPQQKKVRNSCSTELRIEAAFEKAGIQFTDDESGGIGVRLLKKKR
jgi:hypothetical protein